MLFHFRHSFVCISKLEIGQDQHLFLKVSLLESFNVSFNSKPFKGSINIKLKTGLQSKTLTIFVQETLEAVELFPLSQICLKLSTS